MRAGQYRGLTDTMRAMMRQVAEKMNAISLNRGTNCNEYGRSRGHY